MASLTPSVGDGRGGLACCDSWGRKVSDKTEQLSWTRPRVCLVDHGDFICSLYTWWEGFGSSSLATLPLGFNYGFISTSTCGSSTGVCSWGCPGGLGFAPVRARCGGGAAAWVAGVLAEPGTQGGWQLGQQEIWCSRRYGNHYWPTHSSILAWRTPFLTEQHGRPQSTGSQRVGQDWSDPVCINTRLFFFSPVAGLNQWELSVKMRQVLGLQGPWRQQVFRDTGCPLSRS